MTSGLKLGLALAAAAALGLAGWTALNKGQIFAQSQAVAQLQAQAQAPTQAPVGVGAL